MADHATAASTGPAPADPARLALGFRHDDRLLDPTSAGVQVWQVSVTTGDGEPVGSLRAVRGLWWKAVDLRERLTDEGSFVAEVARQLLDEDGAFSGDFTEVIDTPRGVLILDRCEMTTPWNDALTLAAVVAAVLDRLAGHHCTVVLPRDGAPGSVGAAMLERAGALLAAIEFTDELLLVDASGGEFATAAIRVRDRLIDRARHGGFDRDDLDEEDWLDNQEYRALTPRTASLLRLAMEQLSQKAWQEIAALGDDVLPDGAGGLFGSLPPLADGNAVPVCRGEEMALHLGIRRAQSIHRNRPRLLAQAVEGLPAAGRDFDWYACAGLLFKDHNTLIRTDEALHATEDDDSDANHSPNIPNMAPPDWFTALDTNRTRDPHRGLRHP